MMAVAPTVPERQSVELPANAASTLTAKLRALDVPGAQVSVGSSMQPVWDFSAGLANKASGRAVTANTRFEAASLSKPVFACAVLKLCEAGKLSLDAQLGDLLPAEDLPDDRRIGKVNVKQILTHCSGIETVPPKGRSTKLLFTPGSRFAYSPHAFDFLQRAAERASGLPIERLAASMVIEPLKMLHSVFGWLEDRNLRAAGYGLEGIAGQTINERVAGMTSLQRTALKQDYPLMNFPNAASSLVTTAGDYVRFLQGVSRPEPAGLFSDRLTAELKEVRVTAGQRIGWGLALGLVRSKRNGLALWQWGDSGIFQHFAVHLLDTDLSLVCLTNGARGQRFNRAVIELFLAEDLDCFKWLRV